MSLLDRIQEADLLQAEINLKRPITGKNLEKIKDYWRIGLTYTSNALEGNKLTETETKIIIEDGITIGGKSLRDTLECIGHANAVQYMYKQKDIEDESLMLNLHKIFFSGIDIENAGVYRKDNVIITGTAYKPPDFREVPDLIKKAFSENKKQHPIITAAEKHLIVANIHPFIDGNGRTARLLMNFHMLKNGFPVVSIPPIVRAKYIFSCDQGSRGNKDIFYDFAVSQVIEAQRDYMRLLQ